MFDLRRDRFSFFFFSYQLSHNESNFLVSLDVTHILLNKKNQIPPPVILCSIQFYIGKKLN